MTNEYKNGTLEPYQNGLLPPDHWKGGYVKIDQESGQIICSVDSEGNEIHEKKHDLDEKTQKFLDEVLERLENFQKKR